MIYERQVGCHLIDSYILNKTVGPLSSGTRVELVVPEAGLVPIHGTIAVRIEHISNKLREQLECAAPEMLGAFAVEPTLITKLRKRIY